MVNMRPPKGSPGNIWVLMKSDGGGGLAPQLATQQESLDAFDKLVRREVLSVVLASLGDDLFTHGQRILISAVLTGVALVDTISLFAHGGMENVVFWHTTVFCVTWTFGLNPIILMACDRVGRNCLHLTGCCQIAYLILATSFVFGVAVIVFQVHVVVVRLAC